MCGAGVGQGNAGDNKAIRLACQFQLTNTINHSTECKYSGNRKRPMNLSNHNLSLKMLLSFGLLFSSAACQQSITPNSKVPISYGEDVSLGSVYWVSGCSSTLRQVSDLTITSGDVSNLEFTLKRDLMVTPNQCPNTQVPGAIVYARMKNPVQVPQETTVSYTVRYDTTTGLTTSNHKRTLLLQPSGGAKARVL